MYVAVTKISYMYMIIVFNAVPCKKRNSIAQCSRGMLPNLYLFIHSIKKKIQGSTP